MKREFCFLIDPFSLSVCVCVIVRRLQSVCRIQTIRVRLSFPAVASRVTDRKSISSSFEVLYALIKSAPKTYTFFLSLSFSLKNTTFFTTGIFLLLVSLPFHACFDCINILVKIEVINIDVGVTNKWFEGVPPPPPVASQEITRPCVPVDFSFEAPKRRPRSRFRVRAAIRGYSSCALSRFYSRLALLGFFEEESGVN